MTEQDETLADRAVRQFHEAKDALNAFLSDPDIRELMQEYEELVVGFNTRLDQAVRAVKSQLRTLDQNKLIIDGIGAQKKFSTGYDVDFLANALPAEQADLILTEKVVYELDRDLLEQLRRQGEIDEEIVSRAYRREELNPSNMPGTPKKFVIPSVPTDD